MPIHVTVAEVYLNPDIHRGRRTTAVSSNAND